MSFSFSPPPSPTKYPIRFFRAACALISSGYPQGTLSNTSGAIAQGENVAISRHGLMLIAREADGSMRDAQTILERAIAYCGMEIGDADLQDMLGHIDRQIICRVLKAVIAEDAKGCIDALDEVYQLGIDLKQFYFSLLETLRDIMILKSVKDPARLVDAADDDMAQLQELEAGVTRQELLRMFRLCFSSENDIVRSCPSADRPGGVPAGNDGAEAGPAT